MPRVGFEPTISGGEQPKTYALDRAATGTGTCMYVCMYSVQKLMQRTRIQFRQEFSNRGLCVCYASLQKRKKTLRKGML